MLRETRKQITEELIYVLKGFNITGFSAISIEDYFQITPDSFIWMLTIDDKLYYLYAEDYIASLDGVVDIIKRFTGDVKGQFVTTWLPPEDFAQSSPVKNAVVYELPKDKTEIEKYAVHSGIDTAFLYEVDA